MKEIDEAIERVLAGLREAEPDAGIERRVLAAVRERDAAETPRSSGVWRWTQPSAWQMGGLAAALVLVLLLWMPRHKRPREHGSGDRRVASVPVPTGREAAPGEGERGRRPVALILAPTTSAAGLPRAVSPDSVSRHDVARVTEQRRTRPRDQAEAAVPVLRNRPAPEEPLTAEERMLVRIARRGRPEEYVALDPGVQQARMSAEKADFGRFFEPTTTEKENR